MASTRAEVEAALRYGTQGIEEDGLIHRASWFQVDGANVGYYRYCTARHDYEMLDKTYMSKKQRVWNHHLLVSKPVTCLACLTLDVE
jgi:hypothetical protein